MPRSPKARPVPPERILAAQAARYRKLAEKHEAAAIRLRAEAAVVEAAYRTHHRVLAAGINRPATEAAS